MSHLLITTYNKYRWRRSGAVSPVVFALMLASSALFRVSAGVFPDRAGITPHPQDRSGENKDARTPSGAGRFSFPEAKPEHVGILPQPLRQRPHHLLVLRAVAEENVVLNRDGIISNGPHRRKWNGSHRSQRPTNLVRSSRQNRAPLAVHCAVPRPPCGCSLARIPS